MRFRVEYKIFGNDSKDSLILIRQRKIAKI